MKKTKVYISLPISGHDIEQVKKRAEEVKQRIQNDSVEAITPFDVCDEKDRPYSYYMGRDIEALIECDGIYVCNGWHSSKGCQAEVHVAVVYDKKMVFESKSKVFVEVMLIDLDKHEMFWLLESAARGSHLRQGLWGKFIDNVFHKLRVSEIRFLHDQCKEKLSGLYPNEKTVGYEDFQRFLARFDIDNNLYRVNVTNPDTGKKETHYAYRFNGRYFVTSSRYIGEEYILMVEEVPYNIGDKMLSKLIKELSVF